MEGGAVSQELGLQKETGLPETPEEKGRCALDPQWLLWLALWETEGLRCLGMSLPETANRTIGQSLRNGT